MMRRGDRRREGPGGISKAALISLVLSSFCLGSAVAQATHAAERADRPEKTIVSAEDVVLYPPGRDGTSFTFLPKDSPQPFDRSLVLSAAQGESRAYLLKTKEESSGEAHVVAYVVDKRRPSAPKAEPSTGLFYEAIAPELKAGKGSVIMWTVVGADGSHGDFVPFAEGTRPRLSPPAKGSVTRTILAYSVSHTGVRSYPSRFVYRLAEPGLPAAAPRADNVSFAADLFTQAPKVELLRGYSEISISLPSGGSLLVDFSVDSPPSSLDDFERIDAVGGIAKLRIPCPYAWSGDVALFYGTLKDGAAVYCPDPLVISLSYPADEMPAPVAPSSPLLVADPSGQGGFLAFTAYDGTIFVSLGNAEFQRYQAPVPITGETSNLRMSWYGEDSRGRRSAIQSGSFSLPEALPDVKLSGANEGAFISGDVVLKPDARFAAVMAATKNKASIHYEFRIDGSFPPEPGPTSPVLGDVLAIACPPGEERSIVLRYRLISESLASEGKILRFTLDRKPPEAPQPAETLDSYADHPVSFGLAPGLGGKDVFASISVDGESAPFLPVSAPLELPGSESGPVTYRIRAYDVDAAGNRSGEMAALSLVVDTTSVYVAENGDDKGDGTPTRPLKSLDAAIAAALRGSKKNVNMRGSLELHAPVQLTRAMSLVGGFGNSWAKDSSTRASLKIVLSKGQCAFSLKGGELGLRRVELRADSAGSGPLIELSDASLALVDSTIAAGSDDDLILISATRSKIDLAGSQIQALRAMSFTAFSSERCNISLTGCSIFAARGVRIFGAFDMDGGSLAIRESLVKSLSDLGLSLFSLRSSSLLMDRSIVSASGGSGFLRLGVFKAVSGEVKNCKMAISWNGPGTLFEIAEGGPSFRHDTMTASFTRGPLRFFDLRGKSPQIWNCILDCTGPDGELLRSDSAPSSGIIVADCVWGFESLVAGALEIRELRELNDLNLSSKLYSSKPIVSESPERSFDSPIKSQAPLKKGSVCVGAALSLGSGYEVDFNGRPRPAPGKEAPDIGADEFFD
jgi:hypothetical protein